MLKFQCLKAVSISLKESINTLTCLNEAITLLKNTLLQKLFFYIFHSLYSLSSLQRGTPLKAFFEKTVWGRRKVPYIYLKTHPRPKEDVPPCYPIKQKQSGAAGAVWFSVPTLHCFASRELLLIVRGDFRDCMEYTVKTGWNADISIIMSLNVYFVSYRKLNKCWNTNDLLTSEIIRLKCIKNNE